SRLSDTVVRDQFLHGALVLGHVFGCLSYKLPSNSSRSNELITKDMRITLALIQDWNNYINEIETLLLNTRNLMRYFSKLRHLPNPEFLGQYNMNLAWQVAMGSQLRLRFEQEVRLRREAIAKIARRDQRIQAREEEIKKLNEEVKSLRVMETKVHGLRNQAQNLETLLKAEVDMKKAAEAKNADLAGELESLRAQLTELQVNNQQLSRQVSSLQCKITGEEKIKAAFEEFKKLEDERKLRLGFADVVSAGIAKSMSEGLKHGVKHGKAQLGLEAIEMYDLEADTKFTMALQALKDLKYPLVDQLEQLKDAPIDLIMASLHLESDTGEDAPLFIRDLCPSSSQLKIPVYSKAEKKKKCIIVCRTHGVGSAHHARSDGVPVSVPIVAPQGLQILLKDAAAQTELLEDESSPRLVRSKSLPMMYNLYRPILRALWESLCAPNVLGKQIKDAESVAAGVATLLRGKQLLGYLSYKHLEINTVLCMHSWNDR
ncbi:hypothetical protein Tco_0360491, partial [Tanacetum coccineum]